MTPRTDRDLHAHALHDAWAAYGAPSPIVEVTEVSANVSTNRVYRLGLADHTAVIAKVSSYGSYFLFAEDHDRLYRMTHLLRGTRFEGLLADVLGSDGRAFTWYDGSLWVAFYQEVQRRENLGRVLEDREVENLGHEIAALHLACAAIAPQIPPMSNTVKGDAIHLLDLLESPFASRNFEIPPEHIGILHRHTHEFLLELERIRYDEWPKLPILVDWNLGNFSVQTQPDGTFRLFSRWDYDWFRLEPRLLDFYFLSRVSSRTGDKTQWTYSWHTLVEPRFFRFLAAYHEVFPLEERDILFLPEVYRFFILNYVIREGAKFFRPDLCAQFRRQAAQVYLPSFEQLDITPLLSIIR